MITMAEILKTKKLADQSHAIQDNLEDLLEKINKVRAAYGKAMNPTSGLRTKEDQIRVYAAKGITDVKKIPMNSGHLRGECIDISDPNGELREWILDNLPLMKEIGFWFEDFRYTKGWIHFSIKPPASNKRIFAPFSGPIPHPEIWNGIYEE